MAQNNYKRIQAYGHWLQRLLNDKLENWALKELFEDAVELLEIYYEIPYKHPFFTELEDMTKRKRNWRQDSSYMHDQGGVNYLFGESAGVKTRVDVSHAILQVLLILLLFTGT